MQCKNILGAIILALSVVCNANAQQIDDTIARELGLVRSPSRGLKSDVFDIELNVNKQTELVFPEQGALDIKSQDTKKFEFLNVNNSLFIQPLVAIEKPVVVTFQLTRSKRAVVLRLKTVTRTVKEEPIAITVQSPALIASANLQPPSLPAVPGRSLNRASEYDHYVALVSFAARSAYAPDRLIDPPKGVSRQSIEIKPKQLQKLIREKRLRLTPLSSYVYRGLHVTVLEIENKGSVSIALVPELVRGSFIAKSFHHNVLGTSDRDHYSALYLISQRSFNDIVREL
jgi:hypothetical protein